MQVRLADDRMATYEFFGSGEPLFSLVGGCDMAARFMRADTRLLAGRFTCYLIDPHGAGGSTPLRDETAQTHEGQEARFCKEVRRALGLGTVTVHGGMVGHSAERPRRLTPRCFWSSAPVHRRWRLRRR
jgi:pimeloyl-ACP methyl ester carboxylesterase